MNWFDNKKTIYPTKMFVNYLSENSETKTTQSSQTKSIDTSLISAAMGVQGVAIEMLLTAAPKIIDKGLELVADTIESFANDKAFPTTVKRNFDVINPKTLSLPSKITLVRGNFAPDKNRQGEIFGDGDKKTHNQSLLVDKQKELHIELDIIQSEDKKAFYFQPASYFYKGESPQGEKIDEIILAFSFLRAGESILTSQQNFSTFLHFEALAPNHQYTFKSKSGYDTSFQSNWINAPFDDVQPYTLVIKIIEIREGNSFAKLLQTVYIENEKQIKEKLNTEIENLKNQA